jgi:hypothetical protein
MCESEAERVLGARLQYYNHVVNAIVFTTDPQYGRMEVAFRLSAYKCITDVSYKERPVTGPHNHALLADDHLPETQR